MANHTAWFGIFVQAVMSNVGYFLMKVDLFSDFTSIWNYVQQQMKVPIPPYIKNVLMFCGFENCHTIATIRKEDIEHMENETRNGNLTDFFKDKDGFQLDDILEGSTKSAQQFEFILGHQKLILSIAKLVKENMDKNGVDGFGSNKQYAETSKAKRNTSVDGIPSNVPFKRQKIPEVQPAAQLIVRKAIDEPVLSLEPVAVHSGTNSGEMATHRSKLVEQALGSLEGITTAMYKEKFDIIQAAVTSDLVTLTKKKLGLGYSGKIKCPYCKETTNVFHVVKNANERGTWNSSNFDRHLRLVHLKTAEPKKDKKTAKPKKNNKKAKRNIHDVVEDDSNDNAAVEPDDNILVAKLIDNNIAQDLVKYVSKPVVESLVNYSDTDESDTDNENLILIEVPSVVMIDSAVVKGVGITAETFIMKSSETLESLEAMQFSDLILNKIERNVNEANIDLIDAARSEIVPIIRNGFKSKSLVPTIYSVNTCAFDSIFSVYACSYFDNQYYRESFELFVGKSRFSGLIKKFFDNCQADASEGKMYDLYDDRNLILNEIFGSSYYKKCDNMIKSRNYIFINCTTGIGGLFGQICIQLAENIASAIELKICSACETTTGKILPFYTVDCNNIDLRDVQKSISLEVSKDRLCQNCQSRCSIDTILNDIIVLEVEPNLPIALQKTISIQHITDVLKIGSQYELLAVIEFDPSIDHFLSHVKRNNNKWKTYNDLTPNERVTDTNKKIYPYLLFYKQKSFELGETNDFKQTLLSFFLNNELRKPLVRKILPSERCMSYQESQHASQASSHKSWASSWE